MKDRWTKIINKRVELKERGLSIDVQVDAKTAAIRQKAVELMLRAVEAGARPEKEKDTKLEDKDQALINSEKTYKLLVLELVEKYIFFHNNKRTNQNYRKSARKLTFDLKGNKHRLREKLMQKDSDDICYKKISNIIEAHLS